MKTKCPIWEKTFHFDINDAFSVLKISVASEKMNSPLVRPLQKNSAAFEAICMICLWLLRWWLAVPLFASQVCTGALERQRDDTWSWIRYKKFYYLILCSDGSWPCLSPAFKLTRAHWPTASPLDASQGQETEVPHLPLKLFLSAWL